MTVSMKLLKRYAKIELARRDFFTFCQVKAPDFYKSDRPHLVEFCNDLQDFYFSDDEVLIVNMPPRHGKSRTLGLFEQWILGKNRNEKIMTGSYNELLSMTFSKSVRNDIKEEKGDEDKIVYSDIFPKSRIKHGDGSTILWSLEGSYNNYLATSPGGTATGFGCSLLVIDDILKNAEEANNESAKEKHWEWFTNTMLSRLEEGGKIIMVMTRWATDDLAGRALEHYNKMGAKLRHITMKAVQDDGTMLCEEILSRKSYDSKAKAMGIDIASANYQQEPIDIKGRLYTMFKTYKELPTFKEIRNYTDTADTGGDYLASINYGVTFANEAYILDILYTKKPMEETEPATAAMLYNDNVNIADIESNNGGRGFARSIQRILKDTYNSNYTTINWFHQSRNKIARIISSSTWVMNHVYYPENWADRFPEFYEAVHKYQREGKNAHDDCCDCLAGICDKIGQGARFDFE